mmetsp:Transcript_28083/g.64274  ORF Transcript_28083/g.64274 Transcript_28083/m.64274 type:complete len:405 (-) Transcript_28083:640-1854(-)
MFLRSTLLRPTVGKERLLHRCIPSIDLDSKKRRQSTKSRKDEAPGILPGVALSAAIAAGGFEAASVLSSTFSIPVSGIPVGMLLGMATNNIMGYPESCRPGIAFSTKKILQGGIVTVAAKLSFVDLAATGSTVLPVVLAATGAGLLFLPVAGDRAGLTRETSLLLAAGTSICGVTAITALAPAIKASPRDVTVAVANTVAFGTMGMLAYPPLFHALCASPEQVGLCLGVGIHDTSQVLGSAMSYKDAYGEETALTVAAVTKLTRNLGLALAIPGLTYWHGSSREPHTNAAEEGCARDAVEKESISGLNTFRQYVPSFLVAFIGMSAFRSGGDLYFGKEVILYHDTMNFIGNDVSKYALGTAMTAVGLSTSASSLRGVGWKPFAVGGAGALVVGGTGFTVANLIM